MGIDHQDPASRRRRNRSLPAETSVAIGAFLKTEREHPRSRQRILEEGRGKKERAVLRSQASFFEGAAVALDSLRTNKMRSFLTLLGIILSSTTLIAVMALIHGMDVFVATSASTMGNDGFRVLRLAFLPGTFDAKKYMEAQRINPQLSR